MYSYYVFVNYFSNLNPRIRKLLFLDSAMAGQLKNLQNHFLRCCWGQEMSRTKVGTFFETTCIYTDTKSNRFFGRLTLHPTYNDICFQIWILYWYWSLVQKFWSQLGSTTAVENFVQNLCLHSCIDIWLKVLFTTFVHNFC